MKKIGLCILFSIFCAFELSNVIAQSLIKVRFVLLSSESGKPLKNTTVVSKQGKTSGITNNEGVVELQFVTTGYYDLRIVHMDRVETIKREVRFNNQEIIISLSEETKQGILVSGERDKSQLSRYGLNQEEIKRIPGVAGDSLKAIQTVPGVVVGVPVGILPSVFTNIGTGLLSGTPYSNSDRGDLSIRGGGTRQNQYFFDGFPLPYPFHLGNQSSVLNNNLIRSFDLYSGVFPAKYGFATGGVIAIEGTDKVQENRTIVNINFFLADIYNQQKLTPSLSMITSGRKNYPNFILLQTYPKGIPEDAKYAEYQDFQWKLIWDITENHRLTVQTFGTRDRQAYTREKSNYERNGDDPRPPTGLDRMFRTDGVRYIWKGNKFRNSISHSRTGFDEFFELKVSNPLTAETIFGLQNRTSDTIYYTEERLEWELVEDFIKLEAGVQSRTREVSLKGENISSNNPLFANFFNDLLLSNDQFRSVIDGDKIRYAEMSAFAEFQTKWHGFRFTPGARVDQFSGSGEVNLSPRIVGGYVIENTKTTILAGHGVHYNSPSSVEQMSNRSGNPNLFMERSEHNTIGLEQELPQGWVFKIEGFRNLFQNIIVPDNFIINPYSPNDDLRVILNNPNNALQNPLKPRNLYYSNSGYGHSHGFEIFIKKTKDPRESSGAFGWLSYTNSITKRINNQSRLTSDENTDRTLLNNTRTILAQAKLGTNYINYYDDNQTEIIYNNDKEEFYDLDRRHILNLVFGYKFNPKWQIGGRFRYFSGNPYTPIITSNRASQAASAGINLYFPEYSKSFNSERFVPFHQIDIRIDSFDIYSWGYINVYFEFVNVYGRLNENGFTFDNFSPYWRGSNPKPVYDNINSPYIQSQRPNGSIINLPLINLGMEVRF
ncbi:TonB-dependent receptor plug domain-containing protein [Leptospira sp. 96542]|nr:TonB-dependent receptor plug domain-containing protein [Leptospira sp. 96542]